jgi:hypothetical protein
MRDISIDDLKKIFAEHKESDRSPKVILKSLSDNMQSVSSILAGAVYEEDASSVFECLLHDLIDISKSLRFTSYELYDGLYTHKIFWASMEDAIHETNKKISVCQWCDVCLSSGDFERYFGSLTCQGYSFRDMEFVCGLGIVLAALLRIADRHGFDMLERKNDNA